MRTERIDLQMEQVWKACVFVVHDTKAVDGKRFAIGSGFVLDAGSRWLLITAAHCLEDLSELAGEADVIVRVPLDPSDQSISHAGIRVPLRNRRCVTLAMLADHLEKSGEYSDKVGQDMLHDMRMADFGFIELNATDTQELVRAGITPLKEEHVRWYEEDEITIDQPYATFLFGLPDTSLIPMPSLDNPSVVFKSLCVELIDEGDRLRIFFRPDWPAEDHTGSVAGMSGGPICLLGLITPIVLGVQSRETFPISEASCEVEPFAVSAGNPDCLHSFMMAKLHYLVMTILEDWDARP